MANPTQLFKKDSTWLRGVIRNLTTDVIAKGKVLTTETRAKIVRKYVDKMITLAKKNTLASRRRAEAFLRRNVEVKKGVTVGKYLFSSLGPKYKKRNGGYSRIIKAPSRAGDAAKMAIVELV